MLGGQLIANINLNSVIFTSLVNAYIKIFLHYLHFNLQIKRVRNICPRQSSVVAKKLLSDEKLQFLIAIFTHTNLLGLIMIFEKKSLLKNRKLND